MCSRTRDVPGGYFLPLVAGRRRRKTVAGRRVNNWLVVNFLKLTIKFFDFTCHNSVRKITVLVHSETPCPCTFLRWIDVSTGGVYCYLLAASSTFRLVEAEMLECTYCGINLCVVYYYSNVYCWMLFKIFWGMRRSAAPSQKGPAPKKALFIPPFLSMKINDDTATVSCNNIGWSQVVCVCVCGRVCVCTHDTHA